MGFDSNSRSDFLSPTTTPFQLPPFFFSGSLISCILLSVYWYLNQSDHSTRASFNNDLAGPGTLFPLGSFCHERRPFSSFIQIRWAYRWACRWACRHWVSQRWTLHQWASRQ